MQPQGSGLGQWGGWAGLLLGGTRVGERNPAAPLLVSGVCVLLPKAQAALQGPRTGLSSLGPGGFCRTRPSWARLSLHRAHCSCGAGSQGACAGQDSEIIPCSGGRVTGQLVPKPPWVLQPEGFNCIVRELGAAFPLWVVALPRPGEAGESGLQMGLTRQTLGVPRSWRLMSEMQVRQGGSSEPSPVTCGRLCSPCPHVPLCLSAS